MSKRTANAGEGKIMSNISFYKIGYIAIMKSTGNGEIEAKAKQNEKPAKEEKEKKNVDIKNCSLKKTNPCK